ncbi:MAG TPA: threonine synthase, partial [Caulobacteraceae bacterium]|nr:threonine synthase [Caulobacteraceae bacterium]
MRYVSTRGQAPVIGFLDAVLAGLAPDGGLYVPQEWPSFTPAEIAAFDGKSYSDVAAAVIGKFAGADIDDEELREMTREAYSSFTHPCITPVKQLYPGISLLELFHGPTLAFKDVAMQILARLYDKALKAQGRTLTIVAATSGDTGGAAVEAFRGASNARLLVLFPEGRISEVQRRFMTTASEANVRTVAVQGSFDDCQSIVKAMFQDKALRQAVDLSGVNS